jgi:hypothetical protein
MREKHANKEGNLHLVPTCNIETPPSNRPMTALISYPTLNSKVPLDDNGTILAGDQASLTRNNSTVFDSARMTPSKHTINRQVLIEVRQDLSGTRSRTPIAHKITDNREKANKLNTSTLHARVGGVTDELGGGAGAFDVGKDRVAFGAERKSEKSGAHVGDDASNDDLLLAGCFDCSAELGVIPGAGSRSVMNTKEMELSYLTSP